MIDDLGIPALPDGIWAPTWSGLIAENLVGSLGGVLYAFMDAWQLERSRNPAGASRATLQKRAGYRGGRKARSAVKRLGLRVVRLRPGDVELGAPCPFCGLPRTVDRSYRRNCPEREACFAATRSYFCPAENLDPCASGAHLLNRGAKECYACAVEEKLARMGRAGDAPLFPTLSTMTAPQHASDDAGGATREPGP